MPRDPRRASQVLSAEHQKSTSTTAGCAPRDVQRSTIERAHSFSNSSSPSLREWYVSPFIEPTPPHLSGGNSIDPIFNTIKSTPINRGAGDKDETPLARRTKTAHQVLQTTTPLTRQLNAEHGDSGDDERVECENPRGASAHKSITFKTKTTTNEQKVRSINAL